MFENENEGIEQETQSDVTEESSSETQNDGQPEGQQAAPVAKEVPFHEHPRWKEVMEERNAERQRAQALEQRLQEMDRRLQESSKPKPSQPDFNEVRTKMAERLKGIDPDFQQYMSLLEQQALSAQEKLAQFEEKQLVSSLTAKFEDLASKSSLDATDKDLYFSKLDAAYRNGQIRSQADVEAVFKAIHEPQQKRLEALKRAAIEEYTKAKTKDASKPTGLAKGKAPSTAQKVDYSKDPAEARAQMIKRMASAMRGGGEQL